MARVNLVGTWRARSCVRLAVWALVCAPLAARAQGDAPAAVPGAAPVAQPVATAVSARAAASGASTAASVGAAGSSAALSGGKRSRRAGVSASGSGAVPAGALPPAPAGGAAVPAKAAAPGTPEAAAVAPGDPTSAAAAAAAATPSTAAPAAAAARYGILLPTERMADFAALWAQRREYLRDRDERRADDIEQHVRLLKEELQVDNLFTIGAALVRESQDALAAGSPALAHKRCKQAAELSPALSDAWSCLARSLLAEDLGNFKEAAGAWMQAAQASWADPRVSRAILANIGTVLLVGLLLAGVCFVVLLFARYAQLYVHDVHHLFPAGARTWQTRLLAAVLVLSPLLLQLGPVPLLFTGLAGCALYASTLEVGAGVAVMLVLAASSFAAEGLARLAAFGGPAADVWLIESSEGSSAALGRLQRRAESGQGEFAVAFSLARRAKREGDLPSADALYRKALESSGISGESLAAARNNLGNVYLLMGDPQKAMAQYQQAVELQDSSAPAHFNLSRAYSGGGVEQLEKVQAEQGRAVDLDRDAINAFTGGSLQVNRKANKFVMDIPLPSSSLEPLAAGEAAIAGPVGDEARVALGGPLPPATAPLLPLGAALFFVALHALRGRIKPSGRCERCGREVCKRCDADARPSEALCAQCVNVFVRRNNVDPAERIRKEAAVHLYQHRRTLTLRLLGVLSGAGHVLLGYPVRGIVFLLMTGCLLASVILWRGISHDPVAVRALVSPLRVGITAALFVAIYGLCLRDLIAKQRAEGG